MKKALAAALAVAFTSTPAIAQNTPERGGYIGGSFGQAQVEETCDVFAGTPSVSCDDSDSAWKIFGGYQINRYFAAEIGYTDLGNVRATGPGGTVSLDISAFDFVGLGILPLGNRFSLYGKAGVYWAQIDANFDTFILTGSESEDNVGVTLGAGGLFNLTTNIAIRAEWQRYQEVGGGDVGKDNIDVLSVGALFRF